MVLDSDIEEEPVKKEKRIRNNLINQEVDEIITSNNLLEDSVKAHRLKIFKRRWYILFLFGLMAFLQGGLLNVWTVITPATELVFNWSDKDLSIMQIWIYLPYLVSILPLAIATDRMGLRVPMIITCLMIVIATGMRSLMTLTSYDLIIASISHILIGASGPLAFTAGPIISALWFPANQRTFATAFSTISGYLGGAICFLFGPMIVGTPEEIKNSSFSFSSVNISNSSTVKIVLSRQIMFCRYMEFGFSLLLFLLVLIYFPSKPPLPPTLTTAMGKLDFMNSSKQLFSKKQWNFWLICCCYCIPVSIYGVWNGLLGINLKKLMLPYDIGWLGFSSVLAGCLTGVVLGKISDIFIGKMKNFVLFMIFGFIVSTFWFICQSHLYLNFYKIEIFISGIFQGIFNNGAIPLYYEMAIEATYPVTELCVATVMTCVYNFIPLIFLAVFFIPGSGTLWMDWILFGSGVFAFPFMLLFNEVHKRSIIDKEGEKMIEKSGQEEEEDEEEDATGYFSDLRKLIKSSGKKENSSSRGGEDIFNNQLSISIN